MDTSYYRFTLGAFPCVCVCDGDMDYRPQSFFANATKEQIEEALREHNLPLDRITTPYTYLVIDAGTQRVLVDMGAGNLTEDTGKLVASMQAAGIDPGSITSVIITHAHPDHIGGALDSEGKPAFKNTRYFIWKGEWDFWFSEEAATGKLAWFAEKQRPLLLPLQDRMTFVMQEGEVLPGIGVLAAPGHTPGHMVVTVSSGGERLMYIGDTVLSPLHLEHPDWTPVYDVLPGEAASSKKRIFDLAADEEMWVIGQHFPPFPSLGHIAKKGDGWRWLPVDGARF
jgi:glyoxylase-like metal-dependent hydrolase (beta-lactamase superfamily II)